MALSVFVSFLQAGFECSTHRRRNGQRLDLLKSTKHEQFAREDFNRLQPLGIRTIRTGARWHLIEAISGQFDFTSLKVILDAAEDTKTQVLLDLLHFGWPDDVNVLSPSFPDRFRRFTRAVARWLRANPYTCCTAIAPINEISFHAWGGGEAACINPYQTTTSHKIKRNLLRAAIASSEVLINELPGVRLVSPEPVIHIVPNSQIPNDEAETEAYRQAQFQAWDMLTGRLNPELGGKPAYLDIIGVNFYDRNEWVHNSKTFLRRSDPRYRPFQFILKEVWERYGRPIFIAETGAEDDERADWFDYICNEVVAAHQSGIPVHGICLYPILNHPGWKDDRHCHNGLFDYADSHGHREVHQPLADAIVRQTPRLLESYKHTNEIPKQRSTLPVSSPLGLRLSAPATSHESFRSGSPGLVL
ncbi:MAG TPA: hypothetical protein VH302_07215 [Bryobacteraceae bacterium]|nr:hypothetical protein [Bryobacteraceae bacterium]